MTSINGIQVEHYVTLYRRLSIMNTSEFGMDRVESKRSIERFVASNAPCIKDLSAELVSKREEAMRAAPDQYRTFLLESLENERAVNERFLDPWSRPYE